MNSTDINKLQTNRCTVTDLESIAEINKHQFQLADANIDPLSYMISLSDKFYFKVIEDQDLLGTQPNENKQIC